MATAFKTKSLGGHWVKGYNNECRFQAMVFSEPSKFGINEGRISKLCVTTTSWGNALFNFDRGWDVMPKNEKEREILETILALYK